MSWHYTLRSVDGHIAQHVKAKDVGWHAGNWYVNAKSIGLEHEGFAAQGAWYTEAMYRTSAKLVRYLALRLGIPLDRQHIIGHDNVPGTTAGHRRAACTGTRARTGTGRTTSTCCRRPFRSDRHAAQRAWSRSTRTSPTNQPAFTGCARRPACPARRAARPR